MSTPKKSTIEVQGAAISILSQNEEDFISLTDMTRKFGDETLIYSWMRNRNTLEFIGIWEQIHNPNFKGIEFETFRTQAGLNSFTLTPRKWVEATAAIGIRSKAGRHGGGTYARCKLSLETRPFSELRRRERSSLKQVSHALHRDYRNSS